MKYLVTGGAGFMGSNFIRYLLATYPDCQVVNLDKLTYAGNLKNLADVADDPRYRFVKGDIADPAAVAEAVDGCDLIVNFAAETHVDRSILEPESFIKTDVFGTFTLLEAAKRLGISRYVQVSTDEVYGSIETGSFTETSPFEPNSPYSASKAGGDLLVRAYHRTYGLPAIVSHSVNFYGPYQYPEKLIPLAITNLLEGKKVPVYGTGEQIRSWIYVPDYCAALDAIATRGVPGEVYNIGAGTERTNLETVRLMLAALGKHDDAIEFVADRPGHDQRYSVDWSKLKALGWQPRVPFEQGITETVEWYRTHQSWWKPLKSGEYLDYYKKQYGKR